MDGKEETVAEEATTKTTTTTTKEEELKEKRKLRRNLSETSAAEVVKKKPLPPVPGGKSAPQLPPTLASPLLSATSPSSSPTSTQILASLAERSTMDESPASPKSESEEDSDGSVSELSSSSETDESQKPRKNSIMKRVKSLRLTSSFVFAKTPSSYKSAGQEGDAPLSPSSSSSSSSSASPSMQRTSSFSSASPSRRASAAFDSNGTGSPVLGRTRGSMQVGSTGDLSSVSSSYSPSSSSSSLRASSSTFTTSSSSSSFSPSSSPLLSTSPGLGSLDRSEEAARKEPEQPAEPEQEVVLTEEELHKMWGVPDVPQAIVFAEPRTHLYDIRLATNEKLIEKLSIEPASDLEQRHDMYVKIFFMTYRSMITSKFVLDKLWERYEAAGVDPDEAETWNPPLSKIRNTICKVIVFWVNNHYRDFGTDGSALKQLKEFIEKAKLLPQFKGSLLGFLEKMVEKKLGKGTYKSFFEVADTVDNCPPSILPSKDWRSLIFNDLDELEVARQLTIGEHHIYAEIQPIELQDLAWSKDKLKFRAPNVLAMIERFNKYSTIFATLLVGEPRIKDRRRLIERFVRIGEHLLEMNSFNMLMAIMSGFGNSAVYRMKHTFASLPRKTLDTMETFQALLSSNGSYKMYRDRLANVTPPIIPFLGVYLTDLTFANDGNPGELRGLTNFRKLQLEYDIIDQVLRYQKAAAYNFKMVPRMVSFLEGLPKLDEQSLYSMSLQHEPRGVKKKDLK